MKYPQGEPVRLFDVVDGGDGPAVVVGIADSGEYAPAFQFATTPKGDAGALVVVEDGSLRWRPLPGMPLILRERAKGGQQGGEARAERVFPPTAALPPYHGFYVDGQRIELLDVVRIARGETGRVVAIISQNLYSPEFEAESWGYLKFGFLVESSQGGLEWYKDADEDLELIARH